MAHKLKSEFLAAVDCARQPENIQRILDAGVPQEVVFGVHPLVGFATVELDKDSFFQFSPDGVPVLVVPEGVPGKGGWEAIEELVAVRTDEPGWWVRAGNVSILGMGLNAGSIELAEMLGDRINVYQNPLTWLRARGRGLCIVDWTIDPVNELRGLRLRCETKALEAAIRERATRAALDQLDLSVMGEGDDA